MLRASQSSIRALSPMLHRHATSMAPLASAQGMSTKAKSTDSKASKKSTKATSSKSPSAPVAATELVDKGDTYRAGEEFFSYNPYSFYDIENSVRPHRCPQPSSEKMEEFCLDKLNPQDDEKSRKLLAEDYGDLVEYPGKPVSKKLKKPVPPVMRRHYDLGRNMDVQSGLGRVSKNHIVRTYEAGDVKQPNEVQILAAEIGLSTKGYLIKIAASLCR
ncbi:hypothetical protein RRG08_032856 [Elysia crispata]|uniref:NADH dehydrogenase [ubiquinone] flavoprotein 3, mitochondrial n=1 Tax=Elysia crispata TaxID=231223 RepID=A0AAE1E0Y0_9GAST|nr:hypothetical protein RRG08_032856 [Elysia crispata]